MRQLQTGHVIFPARHNQGDDMTSHAKYRLLHRSSVLEWTTVYNNDEADDNDDDNDDEDEKLSLH